MSILLVNNLGKSYRHYASELIRFARWFNIPLKPTAENWVLQHITFSVKKGEALGIVGKNGAGKSTLLKMITGVLQPTEGSVHVNGKIAAILELGMGFNLGLTARANVFHALGLMGYRHDEMIKVMPEIEAFAEIGEYFDEPMRTYSSGMQMRVAFSVATAFRPDILIVDEALSVGDTYFQHKSFDRIREFKKQGTSLLLVSHDSSAIQSICNRAILLDKGNILKEGDPEEIFNFYNALIAEKGNGTIEIKRLEGRKAQTQSGTGEAKVEEIALYNSEGKIAENVGVGEAVEMHIKIKVYKPLETLVLGYCIKDRLGQVMWGTNTWYTEQVIDNPQTGNEYKFIISFSANFGVGTYSVTIALHDRETHLTANYDWQDLSFVFNVININRIQFAGCNWLNTGIKIQSL